MNSFILIISGVAGAGKGSVAKCLEDKPDGFCFSVSYTTRAIRPGEIDGKDYRFITADEFRAGIKQGVFLEWEAVHENLYGTKVADFQAILDSGRIAVMEIDVKGAMNIKKNFSNAVGVFIVPPSVEIAIERLNRRGTETEESKKIRINRYNEELSYSKYFDHTIINDDLVMAKKELIAVIKQERQKHN